MATPTHRKVAHLGSPVVVKLAPDVVLQQIGDEAVLLKLDHEAVFSLNGTAAQIAALIGEGLSVPDIVSELSVRYAASRDVVTEDVRALVDTLVQLGLAHMEREGAAPC